jgi:beta-lactamase regulating signal transducer with metallopeptidase domain
MTIYASEASILLEQLAIAAARTTILAAVAALLLASFRVKATHPRLFTWTAVLYAGLCMPLLGGMLPSIHIPVPFAPPTVQTKVVKDISPATATPVHHFTVREIKRETAASTSLSNTPPAPEPQVSWRATFASLPWTAVALGGYLVIALYLLVRLVIGVVLARQLVQKSVPIHDPRLTALIRDTDSRLAAQIVESRSVSVPLTVGIIKATILLPTSWREWDDAKLASVLTHEMSHVKRHDCLSQYVALMHRAAFWLSPLSWWLNRQIIELAEQASDEDALSRGADQHSYARTLLGFLETVQASPGRVRWQGVSLAGLGASSARAEKRLEKVLSWTGEKKMSTNKSSLIAVVVLALPVSYLVAAGHPVSPSPAAQTIQIAQHQAPAAPAQQPAQPPAVDAAPASPASPQAPNGMSGDEAPAAAANPVSPAAPSSPDVAVAASSDQDQDTGENRHRGFWYRYGYDDEQRFVIVSGKSDRFTMSGSGEDARHAERLKQRIQGDFIWFERDEKSYVIRDQATVDRARALWAPQEELGKKQAALGKQQEALGRQQEEIAKRIQAVRVKVPDMTAELDKLKAELQQLGPNATVEQIGRIQSEIGRLQSKIGRIQSDAGDQQGKVGEEMGALGEKQGELGRQQGELGRQQGELAEKANREMKQLLDDAIKKGTAQPESSESGGASL